MGYLYSNKWKTRKDVEEHCLNQTAGGIVEVNDESGIIVKVQGEGTNIERIRYLISKDQSGYYGYQDFFIKE